MTKKAFTNEQNLTGYQDAPYWSDNYDAEKCCSAFSGVTDGGYYTPADYDYRTYDKAKLADIDVGIKNPMTKSEALWKEAQTLIPGGSQTFSKSPMCFIDGVAPKYIESGKGARSWDVDGNQYIDYVMACFPVTLGWQNEAIDEAVRAQIGQGVSFSMMHRFEIELSRRLAEVIPCAEMVRFSKNGSDVTAAAVKLARAVTGRERVGCYGYHGFHDWYVATTDRNAGIPQSVLGLTKPMPYNNIEGVKAYFEQHKGEVACVIMEPTIVDFPRDGFLQEMAEVVRHYGALLIFDEMVTGFRFDLGGAQNYFGVTPDLACFGKGITNGLPLGVIVGKGEYMQRFAGDVFLSNTYSGETFSLAAGIAGIDFYREHNVTKRLWKAGRILMDNFLKIIEDKGIGDTVGVVGYPVRMQLVFKNAAGEGDFEITSLFQQEMFKQGVLCFAGIGLSYAHTDEELMYTVYAFENAVEVVKKAVAEGDIKKYLEGTPTKPVFRALRERKESIGN